MSDGIPNEIDRRQFMSTMAKYIGGSFLASSSLYPLTAFSGEQEK